MKFERPKEIPLSVLQAEIYCYCRNNNIRCCLDYMLPTGDKNMVIIKDDEIILIIEFQKEDFQFSKKYIDKSQDDFDKTGITTIICNKWDDVKFIIGYIKNISKKGINKVI